MVHRHVTRNDPDAASAIAPAYTQRLDLRPIPKHRMPEDGARPEVAYRLIHDELLLDGSSRLNLATFVTTWMEPEARSVTGAAAPSPTVIAKGSRYGYWATAQAHTRAHHPGHGGRPQSANRAARREQERDAQRQHTQDEQDRAAADEPVEHLPLVGAQGAAAPGRRAAPRRLRQGGGRGPRHAR